MVTSIDADWKGMVDGKELLVQIRTGVGMGNVPEQERRIRFVTGFLHS